MEGCKLMKTRYIAFGKKRFIFRDGKYHGWYYYK